MLQSLLRRGRHTTATALCAMISVTVTPVMAQTQLTINPFPPITVGPIDPNNIGLLSQYRISSPEPPPTSFPGESMHSTGIDIAASTNGSVWTIAVGGQYAWQWGEKSFHRMPVLPSPGKRIAVGPDGIAWVVDTTGNIYWFNPSTRQWVKGVGSGVADIAVGAKGQLWVVGTNGQVQQWNGTAWKLAATVPDAAARRIAVDPTGGPWVMGPNGGFRLKDKEFETVPVKGHDIAIGGDGAVWVPAAEPNGVGRMQWWNGVKVVSFGGLLAAHLTVDGTGNAYAIDPRGDAVRFKVPGPVPMMGGIASRVWAPLQRRGKLQCSATVEPNDCGRAVATYVGKHEVNTTCSSGFYDPIRGGTCWKCPDDDGNGAWIRSLDAVTATTACWRSPKESFSVATKVKTTGLAWECAEGSFWDGKGGGACYTCPSTHPRRTGFSIDDSQGRACASPSNETESAIFLKYNGCPTPDRDALNFTGYKQPGYPFLDIGAGGCFVCPVVATDGTFLVSLRNGVALYSQDAETNVAYSSTRTLKQGCDVSYRYEPTPFWQPGLSGLRGAMEMVVEARLFEYPELMTGYLYSLADAEGLSGTEAKTWVTNKWTELATDPINSSALRSVVYLMLQGAVKKEPMLRTRMETQLIESFANYIVLRRTYYAQTGLEMYDAWKDRSDAFQASIAKSPLGELFSYGIVPLDFKNTILSIAGSAGLGAMVVMSGAAAYNMKEGARNAALNNLDTGLEAKTGGSSPSKAVETATKTAKISKPPSTTTANLSKLVQAVRGMSAATTGVLMAGVVTQIAVAVLAGIAAEQLMRIENARPELLAMLAKARQTVDVTKLMSTDDGMDQALLYWGQAMDVREATIDGLSTMAKKANDWTAARGYERPPGI